MTMPSSTSTESGSSGSRFWPRHDLTQSNLKIPSDTDSLSTAYKMMHSLFLRRLARQINQAEKDNLSKRANARPKATLKPEVVLDEAEKVWMDMNRNIKARKRRRREQQDPQDPQDVEHRVTSTRRRRQTTNSSQEK